MGAYEQVEIAPHVTHLHGERVAGEANKRRPHRETTHIDRFSSLDVHTQRTPVDGRPVVRLTPELRLHPALITLGWTGATDELNDAAGLRNQSLPEPILITTDGTILAGFGSWRVAVSDSKPEISCIEYAISEDDALQFILAHHRARRAWNPFVRILLALTLEPSFQQRALEHMRTGGKYKGSSNLTDVGKLDLRTEIAATAGVSAGNVTKAKQLMKSATAEVVRALREGEISIHRAWLWSKESPEKQRDALVHYRDAKGLKKKIRILLRNQQPKDAPLVLSLDDLASRLSTFDRTRLGPINVMVMDVPGRTVVLSEDLSRTIGLQEELIK